MYRFEDPRLLILLLVIPVLVYRYVRLRHRGSATIRYSDVESLRRSDIRRTGRFRHIVFALRVAALVGFIVAFARPQTGVTSETVTTEGIDIVLAMDVSSSMLAEDLAPNRLEAAKAVAAEFVAGRRNDRVGLVVFAGEAFTQAPLTLDHSVIVDLLTQMEVGMIADGTTVGMGLATAVKRLQASSAESKVVVLLTDGRSNTGEIGPVTAAQMAQALGVRIYAIGAGTQVAAVSSFDLSPQASALPRVGALLDPDMERIFSLRPDLVVLYGSQVEQQGQLTRATVPVFLYRHGGLADILE